MKEVECKGYVWQSEHTRKNKTRPHKIGQETRRQEAIEDKARQERSHQLTQDTSRQDKTPHVNKELFVHQKMNSAAISSNQAPFNLNPRRKSEADSDSCHGALVEHAE
jgi:hypothetical protein